jgi:glycosyltransferase involved in cell wall biosynthesis
MISVLIFSRNEEQDLPGCLHSVAWSDDVHLFDSLSTDGTCEIARRFGAAVHQREFDNFASQKDAGLHSVRFRHPWVLLLDADERVPEPLANELRDFEAQATPGVNAARLRRRDFFMGTWLKHAQLSPFYIRLVRPEQAHFEREVNEVLKVDGKIVDLLQPFDHFPFSKGISHWILKHNLYSSMEARLVCDGAASLRHCSLKRALFAKDFNERRGHQKALFFKMPFRPALKFCYMMIIRGAFLDGRAGITYALLQCIYEYFIVLKSRELQAIRTSASSDLHVPDALTASMKDDPPGASKGAAIQ